MCGGKVYRMFVCDKWNVNDVREEEVCDGVLVCGVLILVCCVD